jgi:hypothetical protein
VVSSPDLLSFGGVTKAQGDMTQIIAEVEANL